MSCKKIKIKEGINLHIINTNKFKTNLSAVFLTTPLNYENVTRNALIPMVLRRGSMNLKSMEEISNKLDEMYGASFDCGVDKNGDNHVLKFYMESINNKFLPDNENLLEESLETLFDLIFNPLLSEEKFVKEYVLSEKENLKQVINGKKDNKAQYSYERCIEEMYKGKPYGLYKFGYLEKLDEIDEKNLYDYYQKLISECKIDIFISGEIDEKILEVISSNQNIKLLQERESIYNKKSTKADKTEAEKIIEESMDVSQGKLVLGLDLECETKDDKYVALVYNGILGGTPTSKMFQNVREKANLAYVASSGYVRHKNNIFIRCGIEISNYQKALDIIKVQLEDMKKGEFTDEDIESCKTSIISNIRGIPEEQDSELIYYFGQEISAHKMNYDEYEEKIKNVSREDIIRIANTISINTIYFLKN